MLNSDAHFLPPKPARKLYYDPAVAQGAGAKLSLIFKAGASQAQELLKAERGRLFVIEGQAYPREQQLQFFSQLFNKAAETVGVGIDGYLHAPSRYSSDVREQWDRYREEFCPIETIRSVSDRAKVVCESDYYDFLIRIYSLLLFFDRDMGKSDQPAMTNDFYNYLQPVIAHALGQIKSVVRQVQSVTHNKNPSIDFARPRLVEGKSNDYVPA